VAVQLYYNDFGQYPVGPGVPTGWRRVWRNENDTWEIAAVAAAPSGKVLRVRSTADARRLLVWDQIPPHADAEVLLKYRTSSIGGTRDPWYPIRIRCNDVVGAGVPTSGYSGLYVNVSASTDAETILRYLTVAPTVTFIGPRIIFQPRVLQWMWMRMRVVGSNIKMKRWHDDATEPAGWEVDINDTAITGSGLSGIGDFAPFGGLVDYRDFAFFSVLTDPGSSSAPSSITPDAPRNLTASCTVPAAQSKRVTIAWDAPPADPIRITRVHAEASIQGVGVELLNYQRTTRVHAEVPIEEVGVELDSYQRTTHVFTEVLIEP
jgi:hypothetical protein